MRFGFFGRLLGGKTSPPDPRRLTGATRAWAASPRARPARSRAAEAEGFARAVRDHGLTGADLRRLHRQYALHGYALTAGALFALAFGVTTAFLTFGPALALLAVLLALLFLAAGAASSLRAWQLRERRLGAFGEWARRPRAWFPPLCS